MNAWVAEKTEVSPELIYVMVKRQRMDLKNEGGTIALCVALGEADHYDITAGEKLVGNLFIGDSGEVFLLPVTKYFYNPDVYGPKFVPAVRPVLASYFMTGCRRMFSEVPISRSRTKKALRSLGFVMTGKQRKAFIPFRGEPEDVWTMDLLPEDLKLDEEG